MAYRVIARGEGHLSHWELREEIMQLSDTSLYQSILSSLTRLDDLVSEGMSEDFASNFLRTIDDQLTDLVERVEYSEI